jgi:asparagine synthase (glutamine-hydrolysing)
MCGIFSVVKKSEQAPLDVLKFTSALQLIHHRGPDNTGIQDNSGYLLGHKRLSIIDTSAAANQPYVNSDKTKWLVYNGEIFNFKSLRQELITKYTIEFKTESDTEVLWHWIDKGEDLNALNGFWAFTFFDDVNKRIIFSRDRYGVKPLYYYENTSYFSFCSETAPIAHYFELNNLNITALNTYLQFTYIPQQASIYNGIKQIEPGVIGEIDLTSNEVTIKSYYKINYSKPTAVADLQVVKQNIKSRLEAAVAKRLIADVTVGSFLSGGVDSSIVSILAKQQQSNINCYTVKFSENAYFDESNYAEMVAKQYDIKQTFVEFTAQELQATVFKFLDQIDEPFADASALAMYLLCEKVSKHIKVALTGDGADELFGGYNKHRAYSYANQEKWLKSLSFLNPLIAALGTGRQSARHNKLRQLKKLITLSQKSNADKYLFLAANGGDAGNELLLPHLQMNWKDTLLDTNFNLETDANAFLALDFQYPLAGDMLVKTDRMSMLNSMELRNPFLDVELVNYVFSIPAAYKFNSKTTKQILKSTFSEILPQAIIERPKKGFEVPLHAWFTGALKQNITAVWCNKKFIEQQQIFDWTKVDALVKKATSQQPDDSVNNLWSLIVFNAWYKRRITQ